MKNSQQRDSLLMIVGIGVLSVAFLLGVFVPGTRKAAAIEREIAVAEQAIRDIPLEIARRESLRRDIAAREDAVRRLSAAVPAQTEIPAVIRQVARLAEDAHLKVTRLEPLPVIDHSAHREIPMRITLSGPFAGIVGFLHGLETQPRLFRFGDYALKGESGGNGQTTEADIHFSVYAANSGNAGSAGNNDSSGPASSDRNRD